MATQSRQILTVPSGVAPKSSSLIPSSVDRALDKEFPSKPGTTPGISVRNGPVDEMDLDKPLSGAMNGKRKSRDSMVKTYKEDSESDDDKPLVTTLDAHVRSTANH